jgi:hypothetical protein
MKQDFEFEYAKKRIELDK